MDRNKDLYWKVKDTRRGTMVSPLYTFTDRRGTLFQEHDIFFVRYKGIYKINTQRVRDKSTVMIYEEDFRFMDFFLKGDHVYCRTGYDFDAPTEWESGTIVGIGRHFQVRLDNFDYGILNRFFAPSFNEMSREKTLPKQKSIYYGTSEAFPWARIEQANGQEEELDLDATITAEELPAIALALDSSEADPLADGKVPADGQVAVPADGQEAVPVDGQEPVPAGASADGTVPKKKKKRKRKKHKKDKLDKSVELTDDDFLDEDKNTLGFTKNGK